MICKVTTSIGSKRELIENSFDICTIKFKLDIFEFLCSLLAIPIDVIVLLMEEVHKQRQAMLHLFSL